MASFLGLDDSGLSETADMSRLSTAYLVILVVGGQVGLPILVATFLLARRLYRSTALINFCATWVVYSVIYSLYQYTDRKGGSTASHGACVAQSVLVHGAAPMAVTAGLILMINVWQAVSGRQHNLLDKLGKHGKDAVIIAPPYLVFAIFSVVSAAIAIRNSKFISPKNGLYCTLYTAEMRFAVPVYCVLLMLIVLLLQVLTAIKAIRSFRGVNKLFPLLQDRKPSPSLIIRVALFNLYSWGTLAATAFFLTDIKTPFPYFVPAALPLAAFVIFGTQRDIMKLILFRRGTDTRRKNSSVDFDSLPTFMTIDSTDTTFVVTQDSWRSSMVRSKTLKFPEQTLAQSTVSGQNLGAEIRR